MNGILPVLLALSAFSAVVLSGWFLPRSIKTRALSRGMESRKEDLADRGFPEGFLWSTGEDAYQHEGSNPHADWREWERSNPHPLKDGATAEICADFWNRWKSDFDLAEKDGQNAHRIGVDWSRLEPEEGVWDEAAFSRYGEMLSDLKRRNMTVFLNLWHFILPSWAARKGGFENPEVLARWEAFAAECAKRYGKWVDYWSTMIDAQIYALRAYGTGEFPPQVKDMNRALAMFKTLVEAHATAYRAIKEHDRDTARVGMIWFFARFESRGNPADRFLARAFDALFNTAMLDAFKTGILSVAVPGGPKVDAAVETAKGTLDWLGVNYYYREMIGFSPLARGFLTRGAAKGSMLTDMGWEIFPRGLFDLLRELGVRYPGVPLMITETGMADSTDSKRPAFIVAHVAETLRAIRGGIMVFGFTYWSLTDNLEWLDGYGPKFGLYRVNRDTMEREETRSARVFRWIASHNAVPTDEELAEIV